MKIMRQKVFFILLGLVFVFGISTQEVFALNAPANNPPTTPSVKGVGEGSAKVAWEWPPLAGEGSGTLSRFVLSYREVGALAWSKLYPSKTLHEYQIAGLNENQAYEWTIMAEATNPSNNSSETPGPNFTTLSGGGGETPPGDVPPGDGPGGSGSGKIENPISATDIFDLLNKILNFLFALSIFIVPVIVIYAAFLMLMGGGDPVKLQKGRMILFWTAIAFILILVSRGLPVVLRNLL